MKFKPGQYYILCTDNVNTMRIYKIENITAYGCLAVKVFYPGRETHSIWDMKICSQDRLLSEAEVILYV